MKVNWDHYSQYIMENNSAMFQTTNQTFIPYKHLFIISPSSPSWIRRAGDLPRGTAHCREHGDAAVLDLHRSEVLEVVPPVTATHEKTTFRRNGQQRWEITVRNGRYFFGWLDHHSIAMKSLFLW